MIYHPSSEPTAIAAIQYKRLNEGDVILILTEKCKNKEVKGQRIQKGDTKIIKQFRRHGKTF